ncbi:unnamed protein product [Owenia fusiformis]|uniref:Protein-tyrosine-phosphatase n=1 Tax=Owenia fusiformis TaxID=6347 RepID=A0A8J1UBV7_OWEFU|nr:unnamed protein product [Owenia fusiformis]
MSEILQGLYIGDQRDAYDDDFLKTNKITHILTIEMTPITKDHACNYAYKFVYARDMDDQDLLGYFQECFDFIEEGLGIGGVLVHCFAGSSRSATIVLGYIMHKQGLSLREAVGLIKKHRKIRPNDGFISQLQLFELMDRKIDTQHEQYKQYRLENLALKMQRGSHGDTMDGCSLGDDPLLSGSANSKCFYKCRKCRRPLFKGSALLTHYEGKGQIAFLNWKTPQTINDTSFDDTDTSKVDTSNSDDTLSSAISKLDTSDVDMSVSQPDEKNNANIKNVIKDTSKIDTRVGDTCTATTPMPCTRSLFIEPIKWMENEISEIEGKIMCPKCSAKLGSFKWMGERCPCGTWVTPAFHINAGKVDRAVPRPKPVAR